MKNTEAHSSPDIPIGVFRLLGRLVLGFFWPRLRIVNDQPGYLTLDANGSTVAASANTQRVTRNGQTVAAFKNVEAIHIQYFVRGWGNRQREWWTVSLKTVGSPAVYLGKSQDSTEASIAAAHLSTVIGKPVVAL